MPIQVTAAEGDCLCRIAVDNGFVDCQRLREDPANAPFLSRPLRAGDVVTVPDREVTANPRSTDATHRFVLRSSPPFNIRFVHGSPDIPYRDDQTVPVLNVSNYEPNLAGTTGRRPLPTGFGFHDDGHADPDTFKVEVWDPSAGGSVQVRLEALRPTYTLNPITNALEATSWAPFSTADAARRRFDALVCERVSTATANTYRSRYMRLVVDEADKDDSGVSDQMLFVTDLADGNGTGQPGDNDTLEILDQKVRATYVIQRCPGSPKCQVSTEAPIGGDERRRIRLHFHLFRSAVGANTSPNGIPIADMLRNLRFRTFKWYRRVYAQAAMAPLLTGITVHDPPQESLLSISNGDGATAQGGVRLTINLVQVGGPSFPPIQLDLVEGETPAAVAARIVSATPAGITATPIACQRPLAAANDPFDVLFSLPGQRLRIDSISAPGATRMRFRVPRTRLMQVDNNNNSDSTLNGGTLEYRQFQAQLPITDDTLHCIVIGRFLGSGLRGQAFCLCAAGNPEHQAKLPYRANTIMAFTADSGNVLDNSNNLPFTSPHESAHVLLDIIHTVRTDPNGLTQLLTSGTSTTNAIDATKRMTDGPLSVDMVDANSSGNFVVPRVNAVQRARTNGAGFLTTW